MSLSQALDQCLLQTQLSPVVIIGMARTGTTMLQRLLASAPNFVSPMMWELSFPSPPGRPDNWKECDRFLRAKQMMGNFFLFHVRNISYCIILQKIIAAFRPDKQVTILKIFTTFKHFIVGTAIMFLLGCSHGHLQ